jgi:hypothetical protein
MFASVDLYCERLDASFWSEPVNALTNLFFVLAGILGLVAVRRRGTGMFAEVLCWWVMAIGVGSLLFHTFALELTKWFDIVPIATFTVALSLFNLRRFAGLKWSKAIAYLVAYFVIIAIVTYMIPDWLRQATNGSTGYLPAWGAFFVFGIIVLMCGGPAGLYDLVCCAMLAVAIFFRAIDPVVCPSFPLGTHFLWHTLNAAMLGVALVSVVRYGAPRAQYR